MGLAGDLELHVWCVHAGGPIAETDGQRISLPGSPFLVSAQSGKANAAKSKVVWKSPALPSRQPATSSIEKEVLAGELVVISPQVRDWLGNDTAAPQGELSVSVVKPDGEGVEVEPKMSIRSGLTVYGVEYQPCEQGAYEVHVQLSGAAIAGSPVRFRCVPSLPDVSSSELQMPTEPELLTAEEGRSAARAAASRRDAGSELHLLYTGRPYTMMVYAVDAFGNELDRGGARVTARIAMIGGVVPPKSGDNNFAVTDNNDGVRACTAI